MFWVFFYNSACNFFLLRLFNPWPCLQFLWSGTIVSPSLVQSCRFLAVDLCPHLASNHGCCVGIFWGSLTYLLQTCRQACILAGTLALLVPSVVLFCTFGCRTGLQWLLGESYLSRPPSGFRPLALALWRVRPLAVFQFSNIQFSFYYFSSRFLVLFQSLFLALFPLIIFNFHIHFSY